MSKGNLLNKLNELRVKLRQRLQNPIFIFFVVSSSQLLDNINISGFITSVAQIQSHYGITYSLASWTLSAYAVTFSSFIMFFGRLSDIVGHHIVYSSGLLALGIISIIAAAVDNIYVLIVFRALQGIAAAATVPPSYAIVAHSFHGEGLKIAIGCLTATLIIALGIGLILGGAFSESSIGYTGVLWISGGYSSIISLLAYVAVEPPKRNNKAGSMKKLDYFGFFLFISGAILLVTGFTEAGESWESPRAYLPIIIGVLLVVTFLFWEIFFFNGKRGKSVDLLIPKQMWAIKNFKSIPVITFFLYGGFFGCFLVTTSYFEYVSKHSPIIVALQFAIPQNVSAVVMVGCLSTFLLNRLSPKQYCICGTCLGFVGIILLTRMSYSTDQYWRYGLPGITLFSAGTNMYFVNYLNLIMLATPLEMQGLISGICLTLGQFGTAIVFAGITSIVGNSNETIKSSDKLSKIYHNSEYLPLATYAVCIIMTVVFVKDLKTEDIKHSGGNLDSQVSVQDETKEFC